jgi:hypothetical protein
MIIYVCDAGSGIFQAFSSKREAEKCMKEFCPDTGRVEKHDIKTKSDMILLLDRIRMDWEGLDQGER